MRVGDTSMGHAAGLPRAECRRLPRRVTLVVDSSQARIIRRERRETPAAPVPVCAVYAVSGRCHGSAYEIAFGSPKRIVAGSAKRIAAGSAKRIADYWTDVWVAADAAAMTAKRTDMHRLQELVRLHRLGTGAREAARLLGLGPNTERRYRKISG